MDVKTLVIIWCIGCPMFTTFVTAVYNYTLEKELRRLLFTTEEYDRFIPPDSHVRINVRVEVYTMNQLDIKDEVMKTSVYYELIWSDPRFNWSSNPMYSTVYVLRGNNENIWVPKIAVANSISDLSVLGDKNQLITITAEGKVEWVLGKIDETHCDCDVTFYPFDTQTCGLTLIGISYTTEEVELVAQSPAISKTFFSENGEWEFMGSHTVTDDRIVGSDSLVRQLKFMLKFRRRPLFLFLNSLLPVTLLSVLNSLIFKLPAESGEKIGFCLTVLLAFAVYVTIVSNHIPTTSMSTSYLSIYLIVILGFGIVAVFITIFVLYCHYTTSEKPVPGCLAKLASHVLMPLSCTKKGSCCKWKCCHKKREIRIQHEDKNSQQPEMKASMEPQISWKQLGGIIDSFCFTASLLINFVMGLVIYLLLVYGYVRS